MRYRFVVTGIEPGPQGSKRFMGMTPGRKRKPIMVESSNLVVPFRNAIVRQVREQLAALDGFERFEGPVDVVMTHCVTRPHAPMFDVPATPGDGDKYLRASCDALKTAGVYADDARVIRHITIKMYAGSDRCPLDVPGVVIDVIDHDPDAQVLFITRG